MLSYPITCRRDDNGTYLATSRDFPELTTFGDDKNDAMIHAIDALEEAIAARIARRDSIPAPSKGRNRAALSTQTELKILLYNNMRARGMRKSDLARKLKWHGPQVDRLFDLKHASRIDQLESAFAAIGVRIDIEVVPGN
jgi:antitoxin HicB